MRLAQRRQIITDLAASYRVSIRRVCRLISFRRSSWYYHPEARRTQEDRPLRQRMKEIAWTRLRYGYRRIIVVLRREGWQANSKRVYRIYQEEGLNLRHKRPRRNKAAAHRVEREEVKTPYECCSMDFVADQLFNGQKFRALTIVDNFSRHCPLIRVGQSLRGVDVVAALEELRRGQNLIPKSIQVDNGSEFISKDLDRWAYENKVTLIFSRPGKPTDNPFIESFNGSFRDECLNVNWFLSLEDATRKIEIWRCEYNGFRPHSSLNNQTPDQVLHMHKNQHANSNLEWS